MSEGSARLIDGQDQYLDRGAKLLEPACTVHAGHAGQMNVHQNNVRQEPRDQLDGILRRVAGADAMITRSRVQVIFELGAETAIIFNNGNVNQHISMDPGNRA
jgi:hypothetical protein